jgi:hypothetical protein
MTADSEQLKKKLHTALKLGGFNVRREFCKQIVDKFLEENVDLDNTHYFDNCIKNLCSSLESQCLLGQSIEKGHIDRALEVTLEIAIQKSITSCIVGLSSFWL